AEGFAEGLASGMVEARREDLLKLLRIKFVTLPPELTAAVRGEKQLEPLTRWFEAALAAPTLEGFAVLIRGR
ncbi:MAG: hypothetical protein L0241_03150, partial [Planctomycetia bacterium]|nr:hypothetical protein [Planctomycetia bacterium]